MGNLTLLYREEKYLNIDEFVMQFKNHPVLFVGTGLSMRYLKNSYSWINC